MARHKFNWNTIGGIIADGRHRKLTWKSISALVKQKSGQDIDHATMTAWWSKNKNLYEQKQQEPQESQAVETVSIATATVTQIMPRMGLDPSDEDGPGDTDSRIQELLSTRNLIPSIRISSIVVGEREIVVPRNIGRDFIIAVAAGINQDFASQLDNVLKLVEL